MKKVYLAGAMEKKPDGGVTWRNRITPLLESLKYEVLNPCINETEIYDQFRIAPDEVKRLKKHLKREFFMAFGKAIVEKDFKLIKQADLAIIYMDDPVLESSGTRGEMTVFHWLELPVITIKAMSFKDLSVWDFGNLGKVVNSIEECIEWLKQNQP